MGTFTNIFLLIKSCQLITVPPEENFSEVSVKNNYSMTLELPIHFFLNAMQKGRGVKLPFTLCCVEEL